MTTARSELEGQIAAKGLALGTARVVYSTKIDVETEPLLASGIPNEVKRFEGALKTARTELANLSDKVSGALARDLSEIIEDTTRVPRGLPVADAAAIEALSHAPTES